MSTPVSTPVSTGKPPRSGIVHKYALCMYCFAITRWEGNHSGAGTIYDDGHGDTITPVKRVYTCKLCT